MALQRGCSSWAQSLRSWPTRSRSPADTATAPTAADPPAAAPAADAASPPADACSGALAPSEHAASPVWDGTATWVQQLGAVSQIVADALAVSSGEEVRSLTREALRERLQAARLEGLEAALWEGIDQLRPASVQRGDGARGVGSDMGAAPLHDSRGDAAAC